MSKIKLFRCKASVDFVDLGNDQAEATFSKGPGSLYPLAVARQWNVTIFWLVLYSGKDLTYTLACLSSVVRK